MSPNGSGLQLGFPVWEIIPKPLSRDPCWFETKAAGQTRGGTSRQGLPGYLGEEAINEVSGRAGVEGSLVVADAAGDEVLHAPQVLEKASVRACGAPVQEARKDVPLGMGQSWRGLEE